MATTYGIISDMHRIDFRALIPAIKILQEEEADALVLNGDISGESSGFKTSEYFAAVLDIAGKFGLETYVLPGSHEEVHVFEPVLAHFTKKYSNIISTLEKPKIEKEDHHLVFLLGSNSHAGSALQHGYILENKNASGIYKHEDSYLRIVNMNDLKKLVSEPEKTIVFSHIPRKFDSLENGVDMAIYWETQQAFKLNNQLCEVGSIFPGPVGYNLAKQGVPIKLKQENRGNEGLKKLYAELGITKNITGHFHESAGRAIDLGNHIIPECLFVPELFYNASCMDRLMVGMVSVDGAKVAYEKVDMQKYLR